MPGTHYDNDHSFIEDLPFDYRQAAAYLIRDMSLKELLACLANNHHSHFEGLSELYPDSHEVYLPQTLRAVLVAKVTYFAKDCFITEAEFSFIEQLLLENIAQLLGYQSYYRESLLQSIQTSHYKSYDWLTRARDESRRYALEIRKRRSNDRRYYRYRAYVTHHFVRLGNHELEEPFNLDIKTSGIVHFSELVNAKLDDLNLQYNRRIDQALIDIHPSVHRVFDDFFAQYQDLRTILNGISLGRLSIEEAKQKLEANLQMQPNYSALRTSQRTLAMLEDFRAKLEQVTKNTLTLLQNSTPHSLYQGPPLAKLKVDFDIRNYIEAQKQNHSYLLAAFIALYHFSHQLERIYNSIASSEFIIMFPEYWTDNYKNLSSGGFAFYSEFMVYKNDILEVMLRIDKSSDSENPEYEVLSQKAKVLRIEQDKQRGQYLIACQFLLAEEHNLKLINHTIQAFEIREAYLANQTH